MTLGSCRTLNVDDKKLSTRQKEKKNLPALEVSEKYIKEYFKDTEALNVIRLTCTLRFPSISRISLKFISTLIEKGYAYEADGDVYYITRKFPEYGKLSGQNIDDLESGARIYIRGRLRERTLLILLFGKHRRQMMNRMGISLGQG